MQDQRDGSVQLDPRLKDPLYDFKRAIGVYSDPTMTSSADCMSKLRNLFEHMPLKTGADPDVWVEEIQNTSECDLKMPFLKKARLLVNHSKDSGATAFQTVYENKSELEKLVRKEMRNQLGVDYFWYDFWSYR
jgi:hypothetical protein